MFNRELYEAFKVNPEVHSSTASPLMALKCVSDSLVAHARHLRRIRPREMRDTVLSLWPNLWQETRRF